MRVGHKSIRVMRCMSEAVIGLRLTLDRFRFPSKALLQQWISVDYLVTSRVSMKVCMNEGKYREFLKS